MPVTERDVAEIQATVAPLLGERVQQAKVGQWNAITLGLGGPVTDDGRAGQRCSAWRLRVTGDCAWRLERAGELVAGDADAPALCRGAVQLMVGLAVRFIELTPPALETTFGFDEAVLFHLFPLRSEQFGPWRLYTPDGGLLIIGPGSNWSYRGTRRT